MDSVMLVFIIVFSLLFSSFLNVVAIRIPNKESIILPPSHCTHCGHRLAPLDLIPVVSYVLLAGKCRYCRTPISPVYLLGELCTASLFTFAYIRIGQHFELTVAVLLTALLSVITISDLLYKIIPDKVNLFGFLAFVLLRAFYHPLPYSSYLIGFLAGGGLLFLIAVVSRGGMGGGDIKLMAVIGMAIGWKLTLLSFFLASLIGGIVGLFLLLVGRVGRRQQIPFGPFIALGTLISYYWGTSMIEAYLSYTFQ